MERVMTISIVESDAGVTLALAGEADLRDAAAFRTALLECLERGRPIVIGTEALETVDFPALQLVYSACRAFRAAGVPISVPAGGGAFRRGWEDAGLPPIEDEQP
jgi:anti-anti-sigma regulatory factor